ncbi:MAG: hypothetical protein ACQEP0_16230 [Natrinema limicola]
MDYGTTNVNTGSWVAFWVMNQERWDSIDDDTQEAMLTAAEEVAPETGAAFRDEEVDPLRDYFEDEGIELYEVPDDDYEEWSDAMADAHDHWIDEMEDRGNPGQEAYDMWINYIDDYSS